MADKYITEYTEQTAPASTAAVLIDEGSGAYKYATIANLLAGTGAKTINGAITFGGAISGVTTLNTTGNIVQTQATAAVLDLIGDSDTLRLQSQGNLAIVNSIVNPLWLYSGNAVALKLDTSQNTEVVNNLTVGTDNLYVSNNRVGMGTTNPQNVANYSVLTLQGSTTSTGGYLQIRNSDNTKSAVFYNDGANAFLSANSGLDLILKSGGNTVLSWSGLNATFAGAVKTLTTTVGSLPAAGTAGRRAFVTDANATTFASIVAAGGANGVPVYDDGTNWRIG